MLMIVCIMTLLAAGCSTDTAGTDASASGDTVTSNENGEAAATTVPGGGGGSLDDAVPAGTWAGITDADVVVLATDTDAADRVMAANEYNDPPEKGKRFVMWTVAVTNTGDAPHATLGTVAFAAVGPSFTTYDPTSGCGVIPDQLDTLRDVFPGGTITGNVCWEVADVDADGLVLIAHEFQTPEVRVVFAPADSATPMDVTYPEPVPPDPDGGVGSRGDPYPPGATVRVGDWDVTITEVTENATDLLMSADFYNDPPADGRQFLMVGIETTNTGNAPNAFGQSDTINLVGDRAVAYTSADACGSLPEGIDLLADVPPGETASGNLCWSVRSDEVDSIVLYLTGPVGSEVGLQFLALR